jgi:hypothetical protein
VLNCSIRYVVLAMLIEKPYATFGISQRDVLVMPVTDGLLAIVGDTSGAQ